MGLDLPPGATRFFLYFIETPVFVTHNNFTSDAVFVATLCKVPGDMLQRNEKPYFFVPIQLVGQSGPIFF